MNSLKNQTLLRLSEIKGNWFADSVSRLMDAEKRFNPYFSIDLDETQDISEYYIDRGNFFSLIQMISTIVDDSINSSGHVINLRLEPGPQFLLLIISFCSVGPAQASAGPNEQCGMIVDSLVEGIYADLEVVDGENGIEIIVKIPTISQQ